MSKFKIKIDPYGYEFQCKFCKMSQSYHGAVLLKGAEHKCKGINYTLGVNGVEIKSK